MLPTLTTVTAVYTADELADLLPEAWVTGLDELWHLAEALRDRLLASHWASTKERTASLA